MRFGWSWECNDSYETALNSSSDVLFTATAEYAKERKVGKVVTVKS